MARTLETILTGTNRLSPVLNDARRDVETYNQTVERANTRARQSATESAEGQRRAAGDVVDANSRVAQSQEDTARRTEDSNRRTRQSSQETSQQVRMSAEEASRQLAETRAKLVDLGQNKTKVDVDTSDARQQLITLRAQLERVAGSNPSPRVRAETEAAMAQLRAVQSQLNRIDGQSVTANVNVDDGGGMRTITAAALALSPALSSVGAVATAGLGVIGPLAVAGAAGLGVLALGLAGVGDTVKLLGQRQEQASLDAGKASGAAGASAAAQASAARQVQSAEAGLANTRANAADSAVRAAEQVTKARRDVVRAEQQAATDIDQALDAQSDAERDLTRAQQDQRQAQDDLTAARRTAQQQIEDLAGNVADNALSQRQAVLDVADAQKKLSSVTSDPTASAEQRERAEINYRQQVRRQEDLAISGRRLADQQVDSALRGVEGSVVVTAAQQRLVDANGRVEESTRSIGDAAAEVDRARIEGSQRVADAQAAVASAVRDQASESRQAAFSIAQGQAGVASAMAAAATASAGAGAAVSDSLARIDQQLAEVNPHTLEFATYVQDRLKPAWDQLKDTAAGGLLPGVQQSIENLMPYFPELDGFVGGLSSTLGDLAVEGSEALAGTFWQDFFRMIDNNADPILSTFVHTLGNTATGFAGIITAFMPMAREVGEGIEDLSEDFSRWGQDLAESDGFRRFTDYVTENWPKIRDTVSNVATVVGNLVEAGLPIGSAYLTGFQLLSEVLAGLPVGVVQALLVAFLAFKAVDTVVDTVGKFAGAVGGLADSASDLPGRLGEATERVGQLQEAVADNTGMTGFRNAARDAADQGLGRLSQGAAGVVGFLGGPWGIALAAGSVMVTTFMADMQDAATQTDAWAQALHRGGTAAAEARAQYQQQRDDATGFEWMKDLDEWTGLAPSFDEAERAAGDLWRAMSPLEQATSKQAEWTEILNRRQNDQSVSARDVAIAQDRLSYWTGEVGRQQGDLETATSETNTALEIQRQTLQDLTGASVTVAGAQSDFYEAVARADGALEGLSGSVLDGAGNLDLQSESGRRAQDVLFGVRDSANSLIDTMVTQGATAEEVYAKDAEMREGFIRSAEQMGISRSAAEDLANQIYGIPEERTTVITADTAAATQAAADLQARIDGLQGRRLTVTLETMEVANGVYQTRYQTADGGTALGKPKMATGGPVHGPGGPTDDQAGLFALSNGEHVWTAAEVAASGGHTAMEEMRREAIANGRGRAQGGPIGLGLQLDSQTAMDSMDAFAARYVANLASTGAVATGSLGGGSTTGGWRGLFDAVKAVIPQARINSTYRPGDPGYHGRNMAVDFGFGSGPGGAGSAGLASINRLIFDRYGSNMLELIYDGIGDDRPDLKNMRPHTYNAGTRAEHHNHVHAVPREHGGPVDDNTLYEVGERGRELVRFDRPGTVFPSDEATRLLTPAGMPGYGPAGTGGIDYDRLADAFRRGQPPSNTGPLFHADEVTVIEGTPQDVAQELAYGARTGGW